MSFYHNANSRALRQMFFYKFKILEVLSKSSVQSLTEKEAHGLFENFSKALKSNFDKETNSLRITLEGSHPEKIGPWLDDFVTMLNQETVNQLVKDLQSNIDSKKLGLQRNISSKRSIYKQRREDELARLHEAYLIAEDLGINDHLFVPNVQGASNQLVSEKLNVIHKSLSNEGNLSIYMKGTKVLQAEIKGLKNRKSDDFRIKGLRDLEEQLTRLAAIKIDKEKLRTVIVDKKAKINVEVVGPKRKLIAILSLILGGVLGIFAVFIIEFVGAFKKQAIKVDAI